MDSKTFVFFLLLRNRLGRPGMFEALSYIILYCWLNLDLTSVMLLRRTFLYLSSFLKDKTLAKSTRGHPRAPILVLT